LTDATATIVGAQKQEQSRALAASQQQHLRALARANEVRIARARLKRQIAAGKLTVAEVLERTPPEARSMELGDLLLSQRRWGQMRVRRLLSQLGLSERKPLGSLTDRQRGLLIATLRQPRAGRT
jgi:fructosamine-3-kinase